jgi:hypothetical protein
MLKRARALLLDAAKMVRVYGRLSAQLNVIGGRALTEPFAVTFIRSRCPSVAFTWYT